MNDGPATEVVEAPGQRRYEVLLGGSLAGFAAYRDSEQPSGIVRTFTHTEIDPAFEGRGLGGALARAALDDARSRRMSVVPLCPFIRAYIERHPEYEDLVVS